MTYERAKEDRTATEAQAAALRQDNDCSRKALRLQELTRAVEEAEGRLRQQHVAWGERIERARKDAEVQEETAHDARNRLAVVTMQIEDAETAKARLRREAAAVQASIDAGMERLRAGKELLAQVPAAEEALATLKGQLQAAQALLDHHRDQVAEAMGVMDDAEQLQRDLVAKADGLEARERAAGLREGALQEAEERQQAQMAHVNAVLAREQGVSACEEAAVEAAKGLDARERALRDREDSHLRAVETLGHDRLAHIEKMAAADQREEALNLRERALTARGNELAAGQARLAAGEEALRSKADAVVAREQACAAREEQLRQISLRTAAHAKRLGDPLGDLTPS